MAPAPVIEPGASAAGAASAPACRLSPMGSGACLLDAAGPTFDLAVQTRIWAVARRALAIPGVLETVPGMNNVMLVFDPLEVRAADVAQALRAAWVNAEPEPIAGRTIEIPVTYGGAGGEDLGALAQQAGLSVEEVVRRHSGGTYTVAAVGAMPGFPYLSGLDPALAWGRRASPRARVAAGAVMIGGAQAGIMPVTAPSGWHILGQTDARLFDPLGADPVLLRAGDTVRFTMAGLAPP